MIGNESSDFLPVTSGVPQGSILGPLLFSNFINDMPKVISRKTSLALFVDDSNCFRLMLVQDDCDRLLYDLNELFKCSHTWGMEFSVKKCKVLRVARVRSVVDRDYFLGGINLNRVAVEKDLGILISHDLSLNKDVGGGGGVGGVLSLLKLKRCSVFCIVHVKK